jgi:CheY-like chemotaxis protein
MVRLIDDLLDVSRITSGKIKLQRQPTAVAVLIHTAIEANREGLNANRIALSVNVPNPSAVVDVDPTRFVQVVSNLLQNAVKFTDPGGKVDINAHFAPAPDSRQRELIVTVADSGMGISGEALPKVFDLFTQGEGNSARHQGGLGIGLALSRRLMELHGGSIDAQSAGPGLGSSFTVRLPVAPAVVDASATEAPRDGARVHRRAVVIDDNKDAADTTAMLVSVMGGDVRVAYDGESGVREVVAFHPDVVFLDLGMPGMDGFETCRRIRREVGDETMIVALTGWGQDQDKRETKRAGFDVHLTKPADPLVLERLLVDGKTGTAARPY